MRIALLVSGLRRRRGIDDRGVPDRAPGDLDALGFPMPVDRLEERLAEMVFLEEMAEPQDGRSVRHRLSAKVDADQAPHGLGVVQGLARPPDPRG